MKLINRKIIKTATKRNIKAIIKSFHYSSDNPKIVTKRNVHAGKCAIPALAFLPTTETIAH
jgi:hypothetical protein